MEYGIFNEESLLERGFYDRAKAVAVMARDYAEDDAHVGPMSDVEDDCEAGYESEPSDEE